MVFVEHINVMEELKVYRNSSRAKQKALLIMSEQGLIPLQHTLAKYGLELVYLDREVKHLSAQVKLGKVLFTQQVLKHCNSTAMLLVMISLRAAKCYAYKYGYDEAAEAQQWAIAEALVITTYGSLPLGWELIRDFFLFDPPYKQAFPLK